VVEVSSLTRGGKSLPSHKHTTQLIDSDSQLLQYLEWQTELLASYMYVDVSVAIVHSLLNMNDI